VVLVLAESLLKQNNNKNPKPEPTLWLFHGRKAGLLPKAAPTTLETQNKVI